jgi:hypothetical protein
MVWGRLRLINREAFYEKRKLFQTRLYKYLIFTTIFSVSLAGGALWEECYCTTLKNLGKDSMFLSDALLHGLISRIVPDDNLEEEVM